VKTRSRNIIILAVIATLIGGGVGIGTSFFNSASNVAEASSLYVAPANAIGPDAFSPSFSTGQLPESYVYEFESGQIPASSDALYIQPRGTYGGPGSNVCDIEGMKEFFRNHPNRAAAWARIQEIEFDEIDSFLDGLQPAFLAQNVKLTMYGFKNGQEYGYEAIIKAGTAVLVDELGLPRARCACGNPLVTDNPPPPETTTTTSTTEPDITIEECPEGTTYYRNEDGLPQSIEPMVDEYVEIDSSETGFNPSPLDDSVEPDIERWEPTYDLCAPECPEYTPEEGEYYDDSWRYENGQWVPLYGDVDPISDTRLLPGWTDDCGVCPPDEPGDEDVAPPSRRYDDSFTTWDPETDQWVDTDGNPVEPNGSDGALTDPVDLDLEQISEEMEQSLEDEINSDYDPCAPVCPLDEYLGNLPTWFPDPHGHSWRFDRETGLWHPSNGGEPQADPPAWITDRLATFAAAYDPNGPCGTPPACPPEAGSQAARYVVDNDGTLWTYAGGTWYSPTGETRTTIPEFPGCSPCPAETARGEISQYFDRHGVRWMRNAQGGWFNMIDDRVLDDVTEIDGYLENCASKECPDEEPSLDDVYTDSQGTSWRFNGDAWVSDADGADQSFRDASELPDCVIGEQASAEAPVTAVVACSFNTETQQHQMRVLTEGLTSEIAVVIDNIPPNTVYTRVGNLFYRTLDARPTGVVEVRIVPRSGPPVIYNHDVGNCMQPFPRSGESGISFQWVCGFNVGTRLFEARGTASTTGVPLTDIRRITHRLDGRELVRGGNTFTLSFQGNPAGAFYLDVEFWDGWMNELLVDVGRCDDVLTPGWSRMQAQTVCQWTPQLNRNVLMTELTGAVQDVTKVWDTTTWNNTTQLRWNKNGGSNTWSLVIDEGYNLPQSITLAVEMVDGFVFSFPFSVQQGADGRCNGEWVQGRDFDRVIQFACGTDANGHYQVQLVESQLVGSNPIAIFKVADSADRSRRYSPFDRGWYAIWNPPPTGQTMVWFTVTLEDGSFNQYEVNPGSCALALLASNAIVVDEPEEPLQIETSSTTSSTLPRVVVPSTTTTTTTLPSVAAPTSSTSTTTTTTTTTAPAPSSPNQNPTISLSLGQCNGSVDPQTENVRFTFAATATASDPDGDVITLTANAVNLNGGRLSVNPPTTTVTGSGTVQFTVTTDSSGGLLAVVADDGRQGFSSDSASLDPQERCAFG